jgi:hypothetical protein
MVRIKVLISWSGDNYSARTGEVNGIVMVTEKTLKGVKNAFRAALTRVTGIDQRQLGHYIQGRHEPRSKPRDKIIQGIRQLGKERTAVV